MHIINNNNMILINTVQDKWILYSDKYFLESLVRRTSGFQKLILALYGPVQLSPDQYLPRGTGPKDQYCPTSVLTPDIHCNHCCILRDFESGKVTGLAEIKFQVISRTFSDFAKFQDISKHGD